MIKKFNGSNIYIFSKTHKKKRALIKIPVAKVIHLHYQEFVSLAKPLDQQMLLNFRIT